MTDEEKIEYLVENGLMCRPLATACVRARWHCEYCGRDLLHDRLGYAVIELDHLLPKGSHPELENCSDNWVASCGVMCNRTKGDWSPVEPRITEEELNDHRDEFVQAARAYIYQQRVNQDHYWLDVIRIMAG